MKLSKSAAYATLAMAYLTEHAQGEPVQARQVARHLGVGTDSALKILQSLCRRRLIQSQLGRTGGYLLTRDPESISLLQIVEAVDGPLSPALPRTHRHNGIAHTARALRDCWHEIAQNHRDQLSQYTLADLTDLAEA